jgi:hypothetical protein
VEFDGHYADDASLILYIRGDFDFDGRFTSKDIDELSTMIREGEYDRLMDLDRNGSLSILDRTVWVEDLMNTTYGDANLDGEFNSSDLILVLQAGEYADDVPNNSGWADGDFGGDGEFDTDDLVLALQTGAYEQGPKIAVAVPEPGGWCLAIMAMCLVINARRRNDRAFETLP